MAKRYVNNPQPDVVLVTNVLSVDMPKRGGQVHLDNIYLNLGNVTGQPLALTTFNLIKKSLLNAHRRQYDLKCFISDRQDALRDIYERMDVLHQQLVQQTLIQNNVPTTHVVKSWQKFKHDVRPMVQRLFDRYGRTGREGDSRALKAFLSTLSTDEIEWSRNFIQKRAGNRRYEYHPNFNYADFRYMSKCPTCGKVVFGREGAVITNGSARHHVECLSKRTDLVRVDVPNDRPTFCSPDHVVIVNRRDRSTFTTYASYASSVFRYHNNAWVDYEANKTEYFRNYSANVLDFFPMGHAADGVLLGVELEVIAAKGYRAEVIESIHAQGHPIIFKSDGSLPGETGFEIVSAPLGLEQHGQLWASMLERDDIKVNDSCGLHVHVTRPTNKLQIGRMLMMTNAPKWNDAWRKVWLAVARRENNQYALNDAELEKISNAVKKTRDPGKRYASLNLRKAPTAEFRVFASSVRPLHVRAAIEMAHAVTVYAKQQIGLRDAVGLSAYAFLSWITTKDKRGQYANLIAMLREKSLIGAKNVPLVERPSSTLPNDGEIYRQRVAEQLRIRESVADLLEKFVAPGVKVVFGRPIPHDTVRFTASMFDYTNTEGQIKWVRLGFTTPFIQMRQTADGTKLTERWKTYDTTLLPAQPVDHGTVYVVMDRDPINCRGMDRAYLSECLNANGVFHTFDEHSVRMRMRIRTRVEGEYDEFTVNVPYRAILNNCSTVMMRDHLSEGSGHAVSLKAGYRRDDHGVYHTELTLGGTAVASYRVDANIAPTSSYNATMTRHQLAEFMHWHKAFRVLNTTQQASAWTIDPYRSSAEDIMVYVAGLTQQNIA